MDSKGIASSIAIGVGLAAINPYPTDVSSYATVSMPVISAYAPNTTQISFANVTSTTAMDADVKLHLSIHKEAIFILSEVSKVLESSLGVFSQSYSLWQDPETGISKVYWSIFTQLNDELDAFEDALFETIERMHLVPFLKYVIIHLE